MRQRYQFEENEFQNSKPFANGWFTEEDGAWYYEICSQIKNGNILEIGSYEGLSLSFIKDTIATNNNKIWSVEKHCNSPLVNNTKKWGIELICEDSETAHSYFENEFFDFVYIDAAHDYKSVLRDITVWLPKVKQFGLMGGHDYDKHWPGVTRAVNETFFKRQITGRNWLATVMPKIKFL